MRYSKETGGFYPRSVKYTSLPNDLIDVTKEQFDSSMNLGLGEKLDVVDGGLVIKKPSKEELAILNTPAPDVAGFIDGVRTACGGVVGINTLATAYPLLLPAIKSADWSDAEALIIDANQKGTLGSAQYEAIKKAVKSNNIPITL